MFNTNIISKENEKFIIFGDFHFGAKFGNKLFQNYQIDSFNYIIDYARDNEMKNLIGAGDLHENKTLIYKDTLSIIQNCFIDSKDLNFILLCGNHDSLLRKSNKINTPSLLFQNEKNIRVIYEFPEAFQFGDLYIDIFPWINQENLESSMNYITQQKAKNHIAVGHFEISGFELVRGVIENNGLKPSLFKKYSNVFSGHYHLRSQKGNINYIGSPLQITWNDFLDKKGFIVYDSNDNSFEFIEIPFSELHKKIIIDDTVSKINTIKGKKEIDFENSLEKILKIYLNRKLSATENSVIEELVTKACNFEIIDNSIILNEIEDVDPSITDNFEVLKEFILEQEDITDVSDDILKILLEEYELILKVKE